MAASDAQKFWDERAREDAFFFVDNRQRYGNADLERFWRDGEADLDEVLDRLAVQVRPTDVVVDLGCGVGRLTRVLAARAATVLAIDVSEEMLKRARDLNAELQNVRWLHGDGSSLAPIADASADACVSHVVLQHIPDAEVILGYVREMGRVLRPGGWTAFQVSNDPEIHRPRRGLQARVRSLLGRGPGGQDDRAWLGTSVELESLRAAARSAGLQIEQIVGEGSQYCLVRARRTA